MHHILICHRFNIINDHTYPYDAVVKSTSSAHLQGIQSVGHMQCITVHTVHTQVHSFIQAIYEFEYTWHERRKKGLNVSLGTITMMHISFLIINTLKILFCKLRRIFMCLCIFLPRGYL